jgi:predicted RNase H-like nuclease
MDDLGGFVVLRATQSGPGTSEVFTPLATVQVEDRDRFRKAKRFDYSDQQLAAGTLYRYRVQAFTLDGYYSPPSNTVELIWKGGS